MRLIKRMTPARRAYLENLLDGPKPRGLPGGGGQGRTGYELMQIGWIEWDFRHEGQPVSKDEWHELIRAGAKFPSDFDERITDAGRRALQEKAPGEGSPDASLAAQKPRSNRNRGEGGVDGYEA